MIWLWIVLAGVAGGVISDALYGKMPGLSVWWWKNL